MSPAKRRRIFERLRERNPHPRSELDFGSPYQLLVAVVLSAQATDKSVNQATAHLFPVAADPAAMVALGEERLTEQVRTIGLFRTKAKNVIALSRALLEEHDGRVPASREALERLPGVGRKTANVVLNVAFGQPTIAVDTHVFRVANRTGLAPGDDVLAVEQSLERTTPAEFLHDAHHWLILHGRYVCQARRPLCEQCPISDLCEYPEKTTGTSKTRAAGRRTRAGTTAVDRKTVRTEDVETRTVATKAVSRKVGVADSIRRATAPRAPTGAATPGARAGSTSPRARAGRAAASKTPRKRVRSAS